MELDLHHRRFFDIFQEEVSEEAFHDKPSWVDPENDACNLPACSFWRLLFPTRLGFPLVSLCFESVLHVKYGTLFGNITAVKTKKFRTEVFSQWVLYRKILSIHSEHSYWCLNMRELTVIETIYIILTVKSVDFFKIWYKLLYFSLLNVNKIWIILEWMAYKRKFGIIAAIYKRTFNLQP